jgi:hypothetical protein
MSRRTVKVAVVEGADPERLAETVNGWWVHRGERGRYWVVTHPGTGRVLVRPRTRAAARRAAKAAGDCFPLGMLAETDPAAIARVVGPDLRRLFYERYGGRP